MNKKIILFLMLVMAAIFLAGCTETAVCGDQLCSTGEELTCPTDCAQNVEGQIEVRISGGWQSEGELSLYWYKSKDISANISSNITSRLGDNWYGSENKNLFLSFNDSASGEIPVDKDQGTVIIDNLEQGEYYFEAKTSDYEFRGVSEKIIVKEDGDYYVDLEIYPANPAVRIKAYSRDYSEVLTGSGKITLNVKRSWYEYGEWNEYTEQAYEVFFEEGEEINGLFFLPGRDPSDRREISFEAIVSKDGYQDKMIFGSPWTAYQEYSAPMYSTPEPGTGHLEINFYPGKGTTWNDIYGLEGEKAWAYGGYPDYKSYSTTIENGRAYFENVPTGTYTAYTYSFADMEKMEAPVASYSDYQNPFEVTDGEIAEESLEAFLGSAIELNLIDGDGKLIDLSNNPVLRKSICWNYGNDEYCYDYTYESKWGVNPDLRSYMAYTEADLEYMSSFSEKYILEYNGEEYEQTLKYSQGYKKLDWIFDDSDSKVELFGGDLSVSEITEVIPKHSYFSSFQSNKSMDVVYKSPTGEIQNLQLENINTPYLIDVAFEISNTVFKLEDIFMDGSNNSNCSNSTYSAEIEISEFGTTTTYEVNEGDILDVNLPYDLTVDGIGIKAANNGSVPFITLRDGNTTAPSELDINTMMVITGENTNHQIAFTDLLVPTCQMTYSGKYSFGYEGAAIENTEKWIAYVDQSNNMKLAFEDQQDWVKISVGESISVKGDGDYSGKTLDIELVDLVQTGSSTVNSGFQTKWAVFDDNIVLKYVQKEPPFLFEDEFGSEYFNSDWHVQDAGYLIDTSDYFALIEE
ncbi:MAG: hypothetical protein HON47_04150 [Candidatus Diapherotrites archaeon]|uniref:Uncharacterized protein n=1 Tax=Candidatus Iainarchaeum sp. TaxID=3101447 RepID=A0A8T5GFZ2_9ARCH|nr:hypothetical protein [Candidatus Diapherotrites archaeon]